MSTEKFHKATLAGGCFWCTEAIFKRLKGVEKVTSGYSGGFMENPSYEKVSSGITGHAEAIQIEFDPKIISYEKLLEIFWAIHDPTTLNRQGADIGTQYKSAIFYHDETQKESAEKSKKKHQESFKDKIVTEIKPFTKFFNAEDYHQNYYDTYQQAVASGNKNANSYCSIVIDPKIQKLLDKFNSDVKKEYRSS
jgi:peptide-methionine (S)-S-oxide reductase